MEHYVKKYSSPSDPQVPKHIQGWASQKRLFLEITHVTQIIHNAISLTRMVVHGQLVEPAVCLSDLYDDFKLDIVRDTRQNLWSMIYRSQ